VVMALRQSIVDFSPALGRGVAGKVVPRLRAPVETGFRHGADLSAVVETVRTNRVVRVNAAVGAGKSVVLPTALAVGLDTLVVHVCPSVYMADDLARYVSSVGAACEFVEKPSEEYPDSGVVCIAASTLVAKWLEAGSVAMPDCVVYHDEVHESDAFTDLVRRLAATASGVRSYVTATATAEPGEFRRVEPRGTLVKKRYVACPSSEWNLYGQEPWAVTQVMGSLLVYEDNKDRAQALVAGYTGAGFLTFRFHSHMSLETFRDAMRLLRSPRAESIVIIADHSFRSCYTFPVERIIDTCEVAYVEVTERGPVRRSRPAYALERYQASGRGSRIAGLTTEYWEADSVAPEKVCVLEAVDAEAVALVLRVLGYVMPGELQSAKLAQGGVPRDMAGALQGRMPLALLSENQLVDFDVFHSSSGRRSPFLAEGREFRSTSLDYEDPRVGSGVAFRAGQGSVVPEAPIAPVRAPVPLRPQSQYSYEQASHHHEVDRVHQGQSGGYSGAVALSEGAGVLRELTAYQDDVTELERGKYYYSVGSCTADISCSAFPDGCESVVRFLSTDKSQAMHYGLSPYNRGVALAAMLTRYNVRTCEMKSITIALQGARERAGGKDLGAVRQWAREVSERLSIVVAELSVLAGLVPRVTASFCTLAEMGNMDEEERVGSGRLIATLEALPPACIGPAHGQDQVYRQHVWQALGPASESSGSSVDSSPLDTVAMPTHGRGMRAVPDDRFGRVSDWGGEAWKQRPKRYIDLDRRAYVVKR